MNMIFNILILKKFINKLFFDLLFLYKLEILALILLQFLHSYLKYLYLLIAILK